MQSNVEASSASILQGLCQPSSRELPLTFQVKATYDWIKLDSRDQQHLLGLMM